MHLPTRPSTVAAPELAAVLVAQTNAPDERSVGLVPAAPEPSRKLRAMTPPADGMPVGTVSLHDISLPGGGTLGIPEIVLAAYRNAELTLQSSLPECGLTWHLLAGIGKVESNHASFGRTDANGTTVGVIYGPALDGTLPGNEIIKAADGGFVRAIGPMQFLPSTWSQYASDGNGDDAADPNNVFDATLGAGKYLCSGGVDLRDPQLELRAILRYNNSLAYATEVLSWSHAYKTGGAPTEVEIAPGLIPPNSVPDVPMQEGAGSTMLTDDVVAAASTEPAPGASTEPTPGTPIEPTPAPNATGTSAPSPTITATLQFRGMLIISGLPPLRCAMDCPPPPRIQDLCLPDGRQPEHSQSSSCAIQALPSVHPPAPFPLPTLPPTLTLPTRTPTPTTPTPTTGPTTTRPPQTTPSTTTPSQPTTPRPTTTQPTTPPSPTTPSSPTTPPPTTTAPTTTSPTPTQPTHRPPPSTTTSPPAPTPTSRAVTADSAEPTSPPPAEPTTRTQPPSPSPETHQAPAPPPTTPPPATAQTPEAATEPTPPQRTNPTPPPSSTPPLTQPPPSPAPKTPPPPQKSPAPTTTTTPPPP
ncbi:lytic transglycosylase domain-containing protein [Nocardia transvalensis]|uniref:lytic transglycosylase domain-containing protein n=1 Tax=Nocardia transvalensis TaxID=37333 RepID=UPI002B4B84E0|nr:lytic transglycosylase domain-containing protein [Nocardia transvalensis]